MSYKVRVCQKNTFSKFSYTFAMTLPFIHLTGSPYHKGFQHGSTLCERVRHNITAYFAYFQRLGADRSAVIERATTLAAAVLQQNPDYHAGMRGIAAGAEVSFAEIAALNMRSEIVYYLMSSKYTTIADATGELTRDGCTTWAVHPDRSPDGHLRIGQNWDWNRDVLGAILHDTVDEHFAVLGFTEAGIFGCKIGLNSAGLGLCISGLYSSDDSWETICTPMHVRFYNILRQRQLDDAIDVILRENRSIAGNFLLGQSPNRAVDIEAGTVNHNRLEWENGFVVHANHFVGDGVEEPIYERRHTSVGRHDRMTELLHAAGTVGHDHLIEFSQDRKNAPEAVCRLGDDPARPPEDQGVTVTACILDLTAREAFFTDGPPTQAEYVRYSI